MSGGASRSLAARSAICWGLLGVFTGCLLLANYKYQVADRRPPTFDDAWYLETSLYFYHRLTHGGFIDFLSAYAASFRTKAPLISVLPIPFYLLLGPRQHTAMLVNFAFIAVSSLYLFLLGRRLFSPAEGLAAAVFFQTMPLAYGLSRVFMADYGLAAMVIAWIYYLVASEGLSRGRANFILGVLLGLGLLMKILFPVYVAGPLLAALLLRRRHKQAGAPESGGEHWFWRACARRPLAAIAIPAAALASTWYAFHLFSILRYAWDAGYGGIGEQYGAADANHWFHYVINQGIGAYYAAAVLVFGGAAVAACKARLEWSGAAGVLLGWIVPPLAAIAAGSNREIRFVLPVLPAFALLLAGSLGRLIPRPVMRLAAMLALAIFPLCLFATLSSHASAPEHYGAEHPVEAGPFILFAHELGWARPPDSRGDWNQDRILEAIEEMEPPGATPRYVVLGVEHPYLNANLLRYLNAYKQYPLYFTSVGYAENSVERAIQRIYSLDARFLVMGEGFHNFDLVEFLNRTNRDLQARLDHGELPFRLRAKVTLHGEIKAAIYGREEPWERFAAGAAKGPDHPLTVDFAGGVRFLGYDWKRRNPQLCEISYYWTVLHPVTEDYRVNVEFRRGGNLVLLQDHFIGQGRYPFYEWKPREIVKQITTVYLPEGGPPVEARVWLSAWGAGGPVQITDPKAMIHQSMIPLRP